jgi:hypothetical protein
MRHEAPERVPETDVPALGHLGEGAGEHLGQRADREDGTPVGRRPSPARARASAAPARRLAAPLGDETKIRAAIRTPDRDQEVCMQHSPRPGHVERDQQVADALQTSPLSRPATREE